MSIDDDYRARFAAKEAGVAREPSPLGPLPKGWRYDPEGHSARAQSDENGRFRIASALPWRQFLVVSTWAEGHREASVPLERSGGPGEVRSVELVLEARAEAQVQVTLLLNGQPLRTASGRVRWRGPQRSGEDWFQHGELYFVVELGEVSFELELDGFPPSIEGTRFSMQVELDGRNARQVEIGRAHD